MQQLSKQIILLLVLLVFSGCGFVQTKAGSVKVEPFYHSTAKTDFTKLADNLILHLAPALNKLTKREPLYVIDFVNLKQLENHSELGFILSSEVKSLVTQQFGHSIYEIEFSKYLKFGSNGSKLLSRNLVDIKNKSLSGTSYALVGTYAFTQRQVIFYLKIIDLTNGVIIKASTVKRDLTDEIILLEQKGSNISPTTTTPPLIRATHTPTTQIPAEEMPIKEMAEEINIQDSYTEQNAEETTSTPIYTPLVL